MCFVLYAGTARPLQQREWQIDATDLAVASLTERDAPIRMHFSHPEIQYIGSTSGCGCDFPHVTLQNGQWPIYEEIQKDVKRIASDRYNRQALVDLLQRTGEKTIELYGIWDGDFAEQPKSREALLLETILDPDFYFKEQGFYTIEN